MPKKKDIPDRWENYSNIGDVIQGTQFVAFKVPLKKELCRRCPQHMWFTPEMLVEYARGKGYDLGLVIDLTFTSRYYGPQDLISHGIEYKKILVEGHVIPGQEKMDEFSEAVDSFLQNPANRDKLIGVHCTHGVNRTGYMISRYMIEKLDFEAQIAIEAVGKARGYPIERENYLKDLGSRPLSEEDKAMSAQDEAQNLKIKNVPNGKKEKNGSLEKGHWKRGQLSDAVHGQCSGSGNQGGGARARKGHEFSVWERGQQCGYRDQRYNGCNDNLYHGGSSHRQHRSDQTNWRASYDQHGDRAWSGRQGYHRNHHNTRPYPSNEQQRGDSSRNWRDSMDGGSSRNWRDSRIEGSVEGEWRSTGRHGDWGRKGGAAQKGWGKPACRNDDYGSFGYHH